MKHMALLMLAAGATLAAPELRWDRQTNALTLLRDGKIAWTLHHDPAEGKPYFHPLALPDGTTVTDLRPADHPWHRGLWWSWKFINGVNYWEEDKKTGFSAGRTELRDTKIETQSDGSAIINQSLCYHLPGAEPLLDETRVLMVSAPEADGTYRIDWTSTFTARTDVKLDRTPLPGEPGGQPWGGYAGLGLRLSPALKTWVYSLSNSDQHGDALNGKTGRWIDFAGPAGGVAFFDHPSNPRHPTPWKAIQNMPFFAPAPLFRSSLALAAGGKITFRYRVWLHASPANAAELEAEWARFGK